MPDYVDQLIARGLISPNAADNLQDRLGEMSGEPQRQSRWDILRQGLDTTKDYLAPGYLQDTPSSPQADRALADPNARPGKIGPPSGPPTTMQQIGGAAGDAAMSVAPELKFAAFLKMLGMANPSPAIARNPAMIARFNDLVARGYTQRAIADELGIGKASVSRYLDRTGQTTAAAENPGFWDSPGSVDQLKTMLGQGMSQSAIAQRLGTTPGNVASKIKRLVRDEGEVPGYQPRDPYFWESPERQERLKQLVGQGYSLRAMARDKQLGAASPGQVSSWIKEMQARHGELKDWVPQGGAGLTTAGRTPTLPKLRSQAGPAPDLQAGQDWAKALSAFLQQPGR